MVGYWNAGILGIGELEDGGTGELEYWNIGILEDWERSARKTDSPPIIPSPHHSIDGAKGGTHASISFILRFVVPSFLGEGIQPIAAVAFPLEAFD
jgi:hypothetical protein